jgi:hypothetical protein
MNFLRQYREIKQADFGSASTPYTVTPTLPRLLIIASPPSLQLSTTTGVVLSGKFIKRVI